MKKILLLLIWCLCFSGTMPFQTSQKSCSYTGYQEPITGHSMSEVKPDNARAEIARIVKQVTGLMTLQPKFETRSGYVANATALIHNSKRLILYNPSFIALAKLEAGNDWAVKGVIAHEVAHHLNNDPLESDGSRPDLELDADRFAGWALCKMGATLKQAQAALYLSQVNVEGSSTHPPRSERLKAVEEGWRRECSGTQRPNNDVTHQPTRRTDPFPPIVEDLPHGMVLIDGGTFQMGCTSEQQDCSSSEKPVRQVTVIDFFMDRTEVPFEAYDAYCDATRRPKPKDEGWGRGQRPVINVSWFDVLDYCNWRSDQEGLERVYTVNGEHVTANMKAKGYRLPTEAEWEYAAREKGKSVLFGNGQHLADPSQMNFDPGEGYKKSYSRVGTYRGKTVEVNSFSPNALGLYNMSGNVWEWCWDWWVKFYPSYAETNPTGPSSGSYRVLRGGSWSLSPQYCRVALRGSHAPSHRSNLVGFRLARTP